VKRPEIGLLAGRFAVGDYADLAGLAREAEAAGFDRFFRSDHHLSPDGDPDRPITECWTTLAGLACDTRSIRIGSLITPFLFRNPVVLARMAATVDRMSGGRLELGLGLGGYGPDLDLMGIGAPDLKTRMTMIDEYMTVLTRLWAGTGVSFDGEHFSLPEVRVTPEPVRGAELPLILGGKGKRGLIDLCVRHGAELNLDFPTPARCAEVRANLVAAAEESGCDVPKLTAEIHWPEGSATDRSEAIAAYVESGVDGIVLFLPEEAPQGELIEEFASSHPELLRKEAE